MPNSDHKLSATSGGGDSAAGTAVFAGHPRGLPTLFMTELWERFSYYGMRALLVLYMTAPAALGGLALDTATAARVYGNYTMAVYLLAIPAASSLTRCWARAARCWSGELMIALGHFALAVPTITTFYAGLILVALGTGLFKPSISALVGGLYGAGRSSSRRRLLDLLHGHQYRRFRRPAGDRFSGTKLDVQGLACLSRLRSRPIVALGLRRCRCRHDVGAGLIPLSRRWTCCVLGCHLPSDAPPRVAPFSSWSEQSLSWRSSLFPTGQGSSGCAGCSCWRRSLAIAWFARAERHRRAPAGGGVRVLHRLDGVLGVFEQAGLVDRAVRRPAD